MRAADAGKPALATLHAFSDSASIGRAIARATGAGYAPVRVHRFPDGESLVSVRPTGADAVLVRTLDHPNEKIVEVLLAADALRRAGARRVTLIAPYLPYMRQDRVFRAGEPLSQRVIGALFRRAFDRVLTVAAHLHRTPTLAAAIGRGARSLSPAAAISGWMRRRMSRPCFLVGPDSESAPLVRAVARAAQLSWVVATKERRGDRTVRITFDVRPKPAEAVLIDDIASTGATLCAAAAALRRRGIRCSTAVAVHALFAPGALQRLRSAGITTIVTTDTIPHPTNAISCAPLIGAALHRP